MPTHQLQTQKGETYFITFTCYKWLSLFEKTGIYEYFNKWFEYLKNNQTLLLGYVIMPNHVHLLLHKRENSPKTINALIGNGKRFLAYEIVKRLKSLDNERILSTLKEGVTPKERFKGKLHQVFRLSFDAKLFYHKKMLETKLQYIHANPVSGNWNLAENLYDYKYSSAGFYEKGEEAKYFTNYREIW